MCTFIGYSLKLAGSLYSPGVLALSSMLLSSLLTQPAISGKLASYLQLPCAELWQTVKVVVHD